MMPKVLEYTQFFKLWMYWGAHESLCVCMTQCQESARARSILFSKTKQVCRISRSCTKLAHFEIEIFRQTSHIACYLGVWCNYWFSPTSQRFGRGGVFDRPPPLGNVGNFGKWETLVAFPTPPQPTRPTNTANAVTQPTPNENWSINKNN